MGFEPMISYLRNKCNWPLCDFGILIALPVGFEPTMELTFTRLTVWTFRPLKQQENMVGMVGYAPTHLLFQSSASTRLASSPY